MSKPVDWGNLRSTQPVSKIFGIDRGKGIERYYIEQFLEKNKNHIQGNVLEVGENTYTKKY